MFCTSGKTVIWCIFWIINPPVFVKVFGIANNKGIFRQVDFRSVLSYCIFKRRYIINHRWSVFLR